MPNEQLSYPSMTQLFLSDPLFLIVILLPILIAGGIIWYRIRTYRRLTAMTARVDQTSEENVARWQEAAAHTEQMIALLTEIRDHLARIAPPGTPAETTGDHEGRSK